MGEKVKQAIIIGAAPCASWDYLTPYRGEDDFVLCADGGRSSAALAGLEPDWYVGDGDSGGSPEGLPSITLPTEKDFTDLEVAVHQALRLGYRRLLLCGCTGGRADHYLANCALLEQIHEAGAEALLLDECNEIRYLAPGRISIANTPLFCYIGIIPLDRTLRGVTLRGVKYPVTDATFRRDATLGVSNEILPGQTAEITVKEGCALLVRSEPLAQP
ncbi:MAG: thiamine diphosphokinase [Clostridiales bacterium]|nr:thiamine diphosphokinase [Clostridiales bacterium]